ncbi:MAG: protein BatD, partial [Desulfobacterales bacterium]|nr:protein BatD [Desulfobacterales bacterium]
MSTRIKGMHAINSANPRRIWNRFQDVSIEATCKGGARANKIGEFIASTSLTLICCMLLSLAAITPALAEVRVSAEVDRTNLAPGESLWLKVTISDGKAEPDLSNISAFKVIPRGTSSSVKIINTHMTQEVTYNYLLIPQRKGRLTIPALAVTVKGQVHRTEPIVITVATQAENNSKEDSPKRDVWVTSALSRQNPYAGQQITYTFQLYNAVQISDAKFQPPEFQGFSAKEIKDRRSYRKVINGREHVVTEVHYILTPLSAGAVSIEPATLQVGILRHDRRQRRSPFDDFFNRGRADTQVLQTEALQLQVKPLPPLKDPSSFSGLVGQFEITAQIESSNLKVGESATLAVTIQGRGNIMDAQPPPLQVPQAFKAYADNPEEEISLNSSGYKGKKIFRTALVPIQAG